MIELMTQAGWNGLEETKAQYHNVYKNKKIITEFIRDDTIGKKRLTSMPDRLTNTIETSSGAIALRPTVINCYSEPLNTLDLWWGSWKSFMFLDTLSLKSSKKTSASSSSSGSGSGATAEGTKKVKITDLIQPIKRSKYPAITEEEEKISKPLQVMTLAIFDAILVHMMNTLDQTTLTLITSTIATSTLTAHGTLKGASSPRHTATPSPAQAQAQQQPWYQIRNTICEKLNKNKNQRTIEILTSPFYAPPVTDMVFLQEVGKSFLSLAKRHERFNELYDLFVSHESDGGGGGGGGSGGGGGERDQNSVILLKKNKYELVREVTSEIIKGYETIPRVVSSSSSSSSSSSKALPVDEGDLFALLVKEKTSSSSSSSSGGSGSGGTTSPTEYLLASFHGDTNGLATKAVVEAVNHFALYTSPHSRLLFGLDANTYTTPATDQQGVLDFASFYTSLHLNSCYTQHPNPHNFTTFHARTFLQPQLNKAITYEEKDERGDKNLKDYILFYDGDYELLETKKDNTGQKVYLEGMVFPTLQFPSDHGITSTVLRERRGGEGGGGGGGGGEVQQQQKKK
jgi:hypothetical protein